MQSSVTLLGAIRIIIRVLIRINPDHRVGCCCALVGGMRSTESGCLYI